MMDKEKHAKNEQIAAILGFRKDDNGHWYFPPDWKDEQCTQPAWYCPDFLEMLEKAREVKNIFRFGLPINFPNFLKSKEDSTV